MTVAAQEPRPVALTPWNDPAGLPLDYAWRFAAGDDPARAATAFDDSRWIPVRPSLHVSERPPNWSGVGWFRRHLIVSRTLQRRPITIRFSAPGTADVYLDGALVLQTGAAGVPEFPAIRSDATIVSFDGASHVLAVRYRYPSTRPAAGGDIGFRLLLIDPAVTGPVSSQSILMHAVLVAIPLFLVFLHLALFSFDRRSRANLFYAMEMAAFALIVLRDSRSALITSEAWRVRLDVIGAFLPIAAILFALLTYYGVRMPSYPRTWKAFVVAGLAIIAASYFWPAAGEYGWMVYFAAMIADIIRVERSGCTVRRGPQGIFRTTFALVAVAIVAQILVNLGTIKPIAGIPDVYIFGIVASAVGMSLYLAGTLGESRIIEAENERKSEELALARELQLSMLPQTLPSMAGLELAAATRTAAEVGGDYYDFRHDGDGTLLVAFGDATGHGLAAGIVLTAAKALFASLDTAHAPSLLLQHCDRALGSMRLRSHRMALMFARLSEREVRLASAAMPPALLHRNATGAIEEIGAGGLPLGTNIPTEWAEARATLEAGDTLLFASDGFAELRDASGRQLGYDGVASAFADASRGATAAAVLESLLDTANVFGKAAALEDDLTLVVVRATSR